MTVIYVVPLGPIVIYIVEISDAVALSVRVCIHGRVTYGLH